MKLIVLSDLHLMVPQEAQHDLGNHARLEAAIERINAAYSDADLVVFAGDLADRGDYKQSYQDLKAALPRLSPPHALTVGNHDNRENFLAVFGEEHRDENGFIQSAHVLGDHHVLVLDSLERNLNPDVPYFSARTGHICPTRCAWLEGKLAEAKGRPVIVILHHHVRPVSIQMDPFGLRDTGPFLNLLAAHGDIRQVISGHIHMTTTTLHHRVPFTTIAGGHSTSVEDFGRKENKFRREGPAQMAVVLGEGDQTIVHFDNYLDDHKRVIRA